MATQTRYKNYAGHSEYIAKWLSGRKQMLFDMLGNVCVHCGGTKDLQFDHINPETKSFGVADNLSRKWSLVVEEAKKCQLLCWNPCHIDKTYNR